MKFADLPSGSEVFIDVAKLTRFRMAIEAIISSKIRLTAVTGGDVAAATVLSQQHGCMTNDALVLTVMNSQGMTHLASQDADFDRVPGIQRFEAGYRYWTLLTREFLPTGEPSRG